MIKQSLTAILLALFSANQVVAQSIEPDELDTALIRNITQAYAHCASYFSLLAQSYEHSYFPEKIEPVKAAQRRVLQSSLIAAQKLESEELAQSFVLEAAKKSMDQMRNLILDDPKNISTLMDLYDSNCHVAMENPKSFLQLQKELFIHQFAASE